MFTIMSSSNLGHRWLMFNIHSLELRDYWEDLKITAHIFTIMGRWAERYIYAPTRKVTGSLFSIVTSLSMKEFQKKVTQMHPGPVEFMFAI